MNLRSDIEQLTLADVIQGDIKNGYSPNSTETETGYWVLGLGALTDAGLNPAEIKPVEFNEKVQSALLEPGDFLISRSNTPDKVGRSLRFKGEIKNCSYPDLMMRFRPNTQLIDPSFLEYQLQSAAVRAYLKSCAAGSSASMVKITKSTVANTPIQLPPRAEQTKIAQILSTWDKAIATTERLLANSQQQKELLTHQLLTGQQRFSEFVISKDYQRTFHGPIPSDWNYVPIAEIANQQSKANSTQADLPVLSCSKYDGLVDSLKYFKKKVYSDDTSKYRVVEFGDFAYPSNHIEEGSIGYQDVYPAGIVSPIYTVFRTTDAVDDYFLYRTLKTDKYRQIFSAATSASVDRRGSLRWKEFSKIQVPLPPLAEQHKIAQVLSTADAEIANLQAQLATLKLEKKALMQQLLTGQRRVKPDADAAA